MEKGFSPARLAFAAVLSLVCLSGFVPPARAADSSRVPGEIVIELKHDTASGLRSSSNAVFTSLAARLGPGSIAAFRVSRTDPAYRTVALTRDADVPRALDVLRSDPEVELAEPNFIYHILDDGDGAPNDPEFLKQWALRNEGQTDSFGQTGLAGADIGVLPLWNKGITGSHDVIVAVIDTGIDYTHPDLAANIFVNAAEQGGKAGVDDDRNGFVDDVHGWNFFKQDNDPMDDHGHGTHVAGIIGAIGNNALGVSGVNWNVSILPVKFMGGPGGAGTLEDAIQALQYAVKMKARILSNSWGGDFYSDILAKAIEDTEKAGAIFITAAGNKSSDNDRKPSYPANFGIANIVSVAATDSRDRLAPFSNYGKASVHVAAPGMGIYSTLPGGKYGIDSGTSMAAPFVAGVAALVLSREPGLTYATLKKRLIETSSPIRGLKGKVLARGRVSAVNAVMNIVPQNDEPDESQWRDLPYPLESPHPYPNKISETFTVHQPGAKYVRIVFDKIDTERNYDKIVVTDRSGAVVEELSGQLSNHVTDYIVGDTATIRLTSDETNNGYGFRISKIQVITDSPGATRP